jgi:hypothetical protein
LYVPGAHNVLNATAAIAVALELEVPIEKIREALETFSGVDRRFQVRGSERGVTVIDDYGHHPTEIRATLAAARACRFERIHVLFQPHRYSRTEALMDDFARAFHQADSVHVMDIYAASEQPLEGVTAEILVERLTGFGHRSAHYVGSMDRGVAAVAETAAPGDAILTLGAATCIRPAIESSPHCEVRADGPPPVRRNGPAPGVGRGAAALRELPTRNRESFRRFTSATPQPRCSDFYAPASHSPDRDRGGGHVLILVAAFLIFNRVERFLINDPRFALNGPEGASETPTLEVAGAAHASHRAIQAVFAGDSGRSVYMLPLADRRVALRAVDWVKDVSIARIWPNRIVVRILERKPVGVRRRRSESFRTHRLPTA